MMRRRDQRGQSIVEFALILPIFLLVLISVFDLGHVVWANDNLSNAAREAARYAIVHGEKSSCPVGPGGPEVNPGDGTCQTSPSKQSIKDTAMNWAGNAGTSVDVYVCYSNPGDPAPDVVACDANPNDALDTDATSLKTNSRGSQVTVLVKANVPLAAPALFGFGNVSLSSTSTMMVNH